VLFALFGIVLGTVFPITQRATAPVTHPLGSEFPTLRYDSPNEGIPIEIKLGTKIGIYTRDGTVRMDSRRGSLFVSPLLTFESRSPDGCWTVLGPGFGTGQPIRKRIGMNSGDGELRLAYHDEDFSTLEVRADPTGQRVELHARSRLTGPVWSHLNAFTELSFFADGRLSILFSPCPSTPIEVVESDYPIGRPARFAYLDDREVLHVVEARSAEKGPFRELASGPLQKNDAITLILSGNGVPMFRVTLHDWASQAGTQLSPTAGWGVPVNAIEFFRQPAAAQISFTLAGTSVGRGYDSVGHAPGVYVNRVSLEALPANGLSGGARK
jgi:hypothetical protein